MLILDRQSAPAAVAVPDVATPADLLAARDRILAGLAAAGIGEAALRDCFTLDARAAMGERPAIVAMLHAMVNADAAMLARDRPLQFLGLVQALDLLVGPGPGGVTMSLPVGTDDRRTVAAAAWSVLSTIEQAVRALG